MFLLKCFVIIKNSFTGLWKDKEEILKLRKIERSFKPRGNGEKSEEELMQIWSKALGRFLGWYS